jgi:hypothetical protein
MTVEYSHRAEPVLDAVVELLRPDIAYEVERTVCSATRMAVQTRNSTARLLSLYLYLSLSLSWPKSSLSNRSSGMAAQLSFTNECPHRDAFDLFGRC